MRSRLLPSRTPSCLKDDNNDIAQILSQLVSEGESSVEVTEVMTTDFLTALSPPLEFEILDIDCLLAAQGAANAIQRGKLIE
ncbi:hypothetical protein DPV78_001546 [Talaromyces pinophilus]|jgi:hypothetical protein|nr:hypothetical protein DPV78_001546 [Talaromyces pinophilus]